METIFINSSLKCPKLSIILLDWSCRESFHLLDYLANQTVPRDQYELVWVEYYDRRAGEIDSRLKEFTSAGKPPPVDRWVRMLIPRDVYYHKHLMYNAGIVFSRGKIVAICDSDAIVTKSFVEAIIDSFERDSQIVLHLDQVRNNDRRFYPFNYPTIEEVTGEGSINWKNGKTTGLWDTADILHTRNYGSCMAALREDLLQIGGADEHIDYLGHVCGPYEMTFRLVNLGRSEYWHPSEFLYHVWHPGQAGETNYIGPHDGRHMSSRALLARVTGRTLPFLENSAVQKLRLRNNLTYVEDRLPNIASEDRLKSWSVKNLSKLQPKLWRAVVPSRRPIVAARLLKSLVSSAIKQVETKTGQLRLTRVQVSSVSGTPQASTSLNGSRGIQFHAIRAWGFARRILESHLYAIQCSRRCLESLSADGKKEISLYGTGYLAEILYALSFDMPVRLKHVYDDSGGGNFHGFDVLPIANSVARTETLVLAALFGAEEKIASLKSLGISPDRIIALQ